MMQASQKFYISILVLCILFVGFSWGFFYIASFVRDARAGLVEIRQEIASHEERRKAVKDTEILLSERASDIEKIRAAAIDKREPLMFIEYLEGIAARTGNRISFEALAGINDTLQFRITIEGGEDKVLRLFRLLEVMPFAVSMREFNFYRLGSEARLTTVIEVLSKL